MRKIIKNIISWLEDLSDNWHIQNIACGLTVIIVAISITGLAFGIVNICQVGWTGVWYQWITAIASAILASWIIGIAMR